ncbi:MAG: CRTAC1 family protein [Planctomycetales bacterium]|nr:CRTAC1 family protein [Planctomycetales bacterium]
MRTFAHALVPVLVVLAGCQEHSPTKRDVTRPAVKESANFVDITEQTELHFDYQNGREAGLYAILESLGGGCAVLDYDRDNQLDVFAPGGGGFVDQMLIVGRDSFLCRGRPGLRFEPVAEVARCATSKHYSHGCAVADSDNDGFADILMTGYGGLQFYHNLGDGTFEEVAAESQLVDSQWSSSAGWGDLNGDGLPDLYVCHYANWSFDNNPVCAGSGPDRRDVCPPREFEALNDTLYENNGDGTFSNSSQAAGLVPGGKGLGVVLADFDHDFDTDIYVANDTTPNFLYQNDGTGKLTEIGVASGTALDERGAPTGSMGTAVGDFDSDGLTDLWVTNFEMETFGLYRNRGQCQFQHISRDSGVNAIGSKFVGFGTATEDFDVDGDLDIAVSNGHVICYPNDGNAEQLPVYLENQGKGIFRKIDPGKDGQYFYRKHVGRGLATGDFDKDGKIDLVFTHLNSAGCILHNETVTTGRSMRVELIGTRSNRDGLGARILLETSAGSQIRHLAGGGSYLSQSESAVTFGVAAGIECKKVTVIWPKSGLEQSIPIAESDCIITFKESDGVRNSVHE